MNINSHDHQPKEPSMSKQTMKILVVGATGGSGRATVEELLKAGHAVTAFSRHADTLAELSDRLVTINGDATNSHEIEGAVRGQDAVIVTLGISENPIRVRLFGSAKTPGDVRSRGTEHVIAAMRKHGVDRLVVQSTFGVGETRDSLRWRNRTLFNLLLKPQIADTEAQEKVVRGSEVEWVLAQPVHLTDADAEDSAFESAKGEVRAMKISRQQVARFLVTAVQTPEYVGQSVALSG
jgi:uncharacterized protein YbjT (DUF2867 family)